MEVIFSWRLVTFQSTRPRGARHFDYFNNYYAWRVSIHAPAWGATSHSALSESFSICFNPRARVGRDADGTDNQEGIPSFNPRARVGRDLPVCVYLNRRISFNPRARVGRDVISCPNVPSPAPFQSTRPRGARPTGGTTTSRGYNVSIHAPAWGATRILYSGNNSVFVSIHAPAWGATYKPLISPL